MFRRPTKAFQDVLAAGGEGLRILQVEGAVAIEGGLPIVQDGKIIGGIGVSGVTPAQDGQIAAAGLRALKE
jgi:glc operon protein GlcG